MAAEHVGAAEDLVHGHGAQNCRIEVLGVVGFQLQGATGPVVDTGRTWEVYGVFMIRVPGIRIKGILFLMR